MNTNESIGRLDDKVSDEERLDTLELIKQIRELPEDDFKKFDPKSPDYDPDYDPFKLFARKN